jgi:hypothetical protein
MQIFALKASSGSDGKRGPKVQISALLFGKK